MTTSSQRVARQWLTAWLPSIVAVATVLTLIAGLTTMAVAGRHPSPAEDAWVAEASAQAHTTAVAAAISDESSDAGQAEADPTPVPDHTEELPAGVDGDEAAAIPDVPAASPAAEAEAPLTAAAAPAGGSDEEVFAQEFPVHAAARQTDDPATHHWAVLVGVNRYQGRTKDTLGSVADALALREVLLRRGWRDDQILVLTDGAATRDRLVRAIDWLARSTDDRSTVVFSFSGHLRHRGGVTALWPTDNQFIWAEEFGKLMGRIDAGRMWVTLQGCHAEGLRAPGLEGDGRIVTYSSRTAEKSYEDPDVGHSVLGYYVFVEGLHQGWGNRDGDGRVSVQEAFRWGAPRAKIRTAEQQTPVIVDGLGVPMHLEIQFPSDSDG